MGERNRRTMERYGGHEETRRLMRRGAADLAEGKEETDCRQRAPLSRNCPTPAGPRKRRSRTTRR